MSQLKESTFEQTVLPKPVRFSYALFFALDLQRFPLQPPFFIPHQKSGLLHDLQYDPTVKRVTVIARPNHASYTSSGSSKVVRSATSFFLFGNHSAEPTVAAQTTVSQSNISILHNECQLLAKMRGVPQIVQLYSICNAASDCYSLIFERMDSNLSNFPKTLSLEQRLDIARDLVDGLIFIHAQNVFHGDIKPDNALLRISPITKKCSAKWCDLGLASDSEGLNFRGLAYSDKPLYRFSEATAPELFLRYKEGSLDLFQSQAALLKMDVYALGILLHFLFGDMKLPPWSNDLYSLRITKLGEEFEKKYQELKAFMKEGIEKYRKRDRDELQKTDFKITADRKEIMDCIFGLLEEDPDKRLSLEQVKKLLTHIT